MVDGDTMMDDVMTSAAGGQQLFHKDAGGGVDAATLIPVMHHPRGHQLARGRYRRGMVPPDDACPSSFFQLYWRGPIFAGGGA